MKKSKLIVLVLGILIAGTILLTNDNLFKADISEDTVIVEGVYIGGINVSGMTLQEATDTVNAYVDNLKAQTVVLKGPKADLTLTYGDLGLTAEVDRAVSKAISVAQYGNLIQRFMNQKDLEEDNLVIEMGLSIDKQLVAEILYNKQKELNIVAIDNKVVRENGQFVFVEGQQGDEIDIITSVNALSKLVSKDYEVTLPSSSEFVLTSNIVEQRGSKEELATIKDLLGTYSTYYGFSTPERATNIETGCNKLNGTILFPGDEISVNKITGPYNAANGYKPAGQYEGGEVVLDYGGGICQVATTIYNAVLLSELEVTERFGHSMTVSYGDISGDAAIATGYKDLKIRNNQDTPIYIEALYNQGGMQFNIFGQETRPANRTFRFETEILSESRPASKYVLSKDYPIGFIGTAIEEHISYSAKYWKIVTVDGVDTEKILVNKTWYRAAPGEFHVGIADATPEQIAEINAMIATNRYEDVKALVESYVKKEPENGTGTDGGNTQTPDDSGTNQEGTDHTQTGESEAGENQDTVENQNGGENPNTNSIEESHNLTEENQN